MKVLNVTVSFAEGSECVRVTFIDDQGKMQIKEFKDRAEYSTNVTGLNEQNEPVTTKVVTLEKMTGYSDIKSQFHLEALKGLATI